MLSETDKIEVLIEAKTAVLRYEKKLHEILRNLHGVVQKRHVEEIELPLSARMKEQPSGNLVQTCQKKASLRVHQSAEVPSNQLYQGKNRRTFHCRNSFRRPYRSVTSRKIIEQRLQCYSNITSVRKSLIKSTKPLKNIAPKLKVEQLHKLRQPTPPDDEKKIFGFGSYVKINQEKKKSIFLPKRPLRDPGWRTFMRRHRKKSEQTSKSGNPYQSHHETTLRIFPNPSSGSPPHLTKRTIRYLPPAPIQPFDEMALVSYIHGQPMPFVTCRSTSRSFNLRLSLQEILSMIKKGNRNIGKEVRDDIFQVPFTQRSSNRSFCPAMLPRPVDYPCRREDIWGTTCVTARCLCFPANRSPEPPLRRCFTKDRWTDGLGLNAIQDHVQGLKKDWAIINGRLHTILDDEFESRKQWNAELEALEPQLKTREVCYNEIQAMLREVQKMRARLSGWRQIQERQESKVDLTRALRRIHSSL